VRERLVLEPANDERERVELAHLGEQPRLALLVRADAAEVVALDLGKRLLLRLEDLGERVHAPVRDRNGAERIPRTVAPGDRSEEHGLSTAGKTDQACFHFVASAPAGRVAAAEGRMIAPETEGLQTLEWVWKGKTTFCEGRFSTTEDHGEARRVESRGARQSQRSCNPAHDALLQSSIEGLQHELAGPLTDFGALRANSLLSGAPWFSVVRNDAPVATCYPHDLRKRPKRSRAPRPRRPARRDQDPDPGPYFQKGVPSS
jgi:hypothetical protein